MPKMVNFWAVFHSNFQSKDLRVWNFQSTHFMGRSHSEDLPSSPTWQVRRDNFLIVSGYFPRICLVNCITKGKTAWICWSHWNGPIRFVTARSGTGQHLPLKLQSHMRRNWKSLSTKIKSLQCFALVFFESENASQSPCSSCLQQQFRNSLWFFLFAFFVFLTCTPLLFIHKGCWSFGKVQTNWRLLDVQVQLPAFHHSVDHF